MEPAGTKLTISRGSVQETLLLPLWGRAFETRQPRPRLVDEQAVEMLEQIDYDFSTIERTQALSQHGWVARALHTDRKVRDFIARHPAATIVNLGCGLDTTFSRIDNGSITFHELDFPDVIELRRNFFPEEARHHSIASSLHDPAWFEQVRPSDGLLFLAGGVFMYSTEVQMRRFFVAIADHFGEGEFFFDALAPLMVRMAKRMVLKRGGMAGSSEGEGWGLNAARSIERWDPRLRVVDVVPMHRGVKGGLPLGQQLMLTIPDVLGIAKMVHLRIEA